ncbi:MAG: MFS transporter [Sedimentisphaerales bacterium]|nr:MFS transporter [Sedimentisphaerales bacterium]
MIKKIDNITILHIIRFLSSLYFYHQVITLYFQARGLTYVQINSLWAVIVGTQALAEVPTGIVADKIGRKVSIIIALGLQFLGEFIFIFADSYLLFVLVCVIAGIGFSFLSGCFEAMMYDTLKAQNRQNDMQKVAGLNGSFALAATMAGSVIGGFITAGLELSNFVMAIILTAFFVFLSFLASFLLKELSGEYKRSGDSSLKLLKDGVNLIKANQSLRRIILLSLLATPFINYLLNFYPPYFVEAKVSGYFFGATLAIASLLGFFASKYAYLFEKLFGVTKGVMLAVLLPGIFYFLMSVISHSILSIVLVIFAFGSMHIQKPIFLDYLNRHIESKNRATVLSLINVISGFYVAVMGLLIGFVADISLKHSFVLMGTLIAVGALYIKIDESHVSANNN